MLIQTPELKRLYEEIGDKGIDGKLKSYLDDKLNIYLSEGNIDHEYFKNFLLSKPYEEKIYDSMLSGILKRTRATLFKAGQISDVSSSKYILDLRLLLSKMSDNNLSQFIDGHLSTILVNDRNHKDIVMAIPIIQKILIRDKSHNRKQVK